MSPEKTYHIGTSGWNYSHWRTLFYPEGLPQKGWLRFYASRFDTVEINYSFYRWPSEKTMQNWYKTAPENFQFTLKAPRTISHIKKFKDVSEKVQEFYRLTDLLKEKAACHLFQLPPSIRYNEKNFQIIELFCETLDPQRKNVIEFRDPTWWYEQVYALLKKYNVAFCITSGLEMPEEIIVTSDMAYFRFHGENYSTNYSKEELTKYARIMQDLDCERVYAYFNNDANAYAPYNAEALRTLLK